MKRLIYILPLLILVFSCTKEVTVEVPDVEQKTVIDAYIETDKGASVFITRSLGFFGEADLNDLTNYAILDAKVAVSDGVNTDSLTLNFLPNYLPPFVYTIANPTVVGKTGGKYTLTVVAEGKTFTAETTIPEPVKLDSVWIEQEKGFPGFGFAWGHLTDPDTIGNNYRWYQRRLGKEAYHTVPAGATFDDKLINGTSFEFVYQAPVDTAQQGFESLMYKTTDSVEIKFVTMDRRSLNYWRIMDVTVASRGNPFGTPVTPYNNIKGEGGFGNFSGFAVSLDTARLKE